MNIAFQAFLLVLFYLPGALFMHALFGRLSKDQELPVLTASMSGRAAAAVLIAFVFHVIWLGLIDRFNNWGLIQTTSGVDKLFVLLSSSQNTDSYRDADTWASKNLNHLACYFISICLGAVIFGAFFYRLIGYFRLDKNIAWLRFQPKWHYVLSGAYTDSPTNFVWVDLLCEIDKKPVVYSGKVEEYWFDEKTGALEFILLSIAERGHLNFAPPVQTPNEQTQTSEDKDQAAPVIQELPIDIPGDTLIVKMSDVKNINIQYFQEV